ncbi:Lytic transglycosylase catalytic [Thermanaerovibrio acidaminovorans DSM 6589]|uniref:Lytic transglycosylase catalytic n=1 Tax=Thermanaerovibrio acidaminovorans (strain ATCC 49978 / DSM 6589 / Su883) TaxID=525903 RepID=D1B7S5_THEAS|nr:lytic transglycosylase domain-containing protein [Thermanaerovibrio acidaminovorans]ACZ18328.1 Lytic transglycosylase catalytic [Thermanaerovibrio acidaminovorans DSM 6589]
MKLGRTWAAGLICMALLAAVIALAPPGFAEDSEEGSFRIDEVNPTTQPSASKPADSAGPGEEPKLVAIEARDAEYHQSIKDALRSMGLSPKDLTAWLLRHPESILHKLGSFSADDQRKVATVTRYIRGTNPSVAPMTALRTAGALVYYSAKYGIPVHLSTAVAHTESRFDPKAVSNKGAMGIMQVMWRVHNGLLQANGIATKDDMFNPEKGVAAGCLLLSRYINAYGSIPKALARYYGGSSTAYFRKVNTKMANIRSSIYPQ